MNTFSHLLMGSFLCDYMHEHFGITLSRADFLYGNILPDYRISFLTRPHYLENNIGYLQSELQRLVKDKQNSAYGGRNFSKHLGIVCHYYTDFFCYAHSSHFSDSLAEHIAYEAELHRFFEYHELELGAISFVPQTDTDSGSNALCLYRRFDELHAKYLASRQSFGNDLVYTILACVDIIFALANVLEAEKAVGCAEVLPVYIPA